METKFRKDLSASKGLLQSEELFKCILETSVYPHEPEPLKELRELTYSQLGALMATAPDVGQLITMLLQLVNAKKTIKIRVFTGYSLLLTVLSIPEDGKVVAVDLNHKAYNIGLPINKKVSVKHKIDFIESKALPVLDQLLKGSFDFAFDDANKVNYWNYHERLMKLLKVGGIVVYDYTLWGGTVAINYEATPGAWKQGRQLIIESNKLLAANHRVQISHAPLGDGITICRRIL